MERLLCSTNPTDKIDFTKAIRLIVLAKYEIKFTELIKQLKLLVDRVIKDHLTFSTTPTDPIPLRNVLSTFEVYKNQDFIELEYCSSINSSVKFNE